MIIQASKRARKHRKLGIHHPSHVPAKAWGRFVQGEMKYKKNKYKEVINGKIRNIA